MDQLLVALDVDSAEAAFRLADQLRGAVGGFKVGSQLFTACGPSIVDTLTGRGDRVFLDLKFHDIPNTVAGSIAAAVRLGVWMVNVHSAGGSAMMRAARTAADEAAAKAGRPAPLVIAVTMLTSLGEETLGEIGIAPGMTAQVSRLARLAEAAGLDGVVASPQELPVVRAVCSPRFAVVTPGIRGAGDSTGDQQRTLSAAQAMAAGSSYLVVGRPITTAPDPRAAAERIAGECRGLKTA
jgi:orotidine-5'-phosphate decarboxylase